MIELLLPYKWTLFAGSIAALALCFLGTSLATRERSMQTLCVGQGTSFGALLGLAVFAQLGETVLQIAPLFTAMIASTLTLLITDKLVKRNYDSRNTYFVLLFAVLFAGSYLVNSMFAGLENQISHVFFGNLTTLTTMQAQICIGIASLCLLGMILLRKSIVSHSFESVIYGSQNTTTKNFGEFIFTLVTLVLLSSSVMYLGFLFTIALLFLPTSLANFLSLKGLRNHLVLTAAFSLIGVVFGFLLSLHYTHLPAVPLIVMTLLFLGCGMIFSIRKLFNAKSVIFPNLALSTKNREA